MELPPTITDTQTQRRYRLGKLLGKGSFAHVFKAQDTRSKRYSALKVSMKTHHSLKHEHKLLSLVSHRHIVKVLGFFEDIQHSYLVLSLCGPNTLEKHIQTKSRLSEQEARHWLTQLVAAVQHLHTNGLLHRDIKLCNLLIGDSLSLCDFGLACKAGKRPVTGLYGTPNYLAPEVFTSSYSFPADVWAIGVVLYAMTVGQLPFQGYNPSEVYAQAVRRQFFCPQELSPAAQSLVRQMLEPDTALRIKLKAVLRHPFLTEMPEGLLGKSGQQSRFQLASEVYVQSWQQEDYGLRYCLATGQRGLALKNGAKALTHGNQVLHEDPTGQVCLLDKENASLGLLKRLAPLSEATGEVYIRNWTKSSFGTVFALTNDTWQFVFTDGSELLTTLKATHYCSPTEEICPASKLEFARSLKLTLKHF